MVSFFAFEINRTADSMVIGNRERSFCMNYCICIVCYYDIYECVMARCEISNKLPIVFMMFRKNITICI